MVLQLFIVMELEQGVGGAELIEEMLSTFPKSSSEREGWGVSRFGVITGARADA